MERLSDAARFLAEFSALRSRVNNNPRNVGWMSKQTVPTLGSVMRTCVARDVLARFLANSPTKAYQRAPSGLRAACDEYDAAWKDHVEAAFERGLPEMFRARAMLPELLDGFDSSTPNPEPGDFDALSDDPGAVILEGLAWMAAEAADDPGEGITWRYRRTVQAWHQFCASTGFDLSQSSRRWRSLQPVFLPPHVSNASGASSPKSPTRLLDQAVRAYVFGAPAAAIGMCRALMEEVLRSHYRIEAEDLEKVIAIAEARIPWVRPLNLQARRRLANQVLHDARAVEDDAVKDFLAVVRSLIERAPPPQHPGSITP